ncbi:MAG: endonuclease NucS domain-containing protein [Flavobacteriaceae bacterium]
MDVTNFKLWLEYNDTDSRTIQSRISNCRTVERNEGDLDQHFIKDNGLDLMDRLSYSTQDERLNANPKHRIPINGNIRNGSATLKQAVKLYMTFKNDRNSGFENFSTIKSEPNSNELIDNELSENSNNFSYERDLKNSMTSQINELFPEYKIYGENEEGIEYLIEGKRIDILLEHKNGDLLAIELKSGTANFKVFGQISMYLGLLMDRFPDKNIRGCIVAGEIDNTLRSATRMTDLVSLLTYSMKLELREA